MSWTTGTQGASATPATDFVNTITGLMSSWTFIETVSAANAGTTAEVEIWQAPGSDWYIGFEQDDANARLRIRVAKEKSGTGATFKFNRFIDDMASSATTTLQADGFSTNTAATIITAGYVQLVTSASGFTYWIGVGAGNGSAQDLIFVGNNSSGLGQFCLTGFFTPTNGSDSFPLFLAAEAQTLANASWGTLTSSGGTVRVAYEYGMPASGLGGSFCYSIYSHRVNGCSAGAFGDPYSVSRNAFRTDGVILGDAYLNGVSSSGGDRSQNASLSTYSAERGTLPGFVNMTSPLASPKIGDTLTVGGTVYTVLGGSCTTTHTVNSAQCLLVDTASAF